MRHVSAITGKLKLEIYYDYNRFWLQFKLNYHFNFSTCNFSLSIESNYKIESYIT